MASTGHCHPKVVKAIQDQAKDFIIAQQNIFTASPAMVKLQCFAVLCLPHMALLYEVTNAMRTVFKESNSTVLKLMMYRIQTAICRMSCNSHMGRAQ